LFRLPKRNLILLPGKQGKNCWRKNWQCILFYCLLLMTGRLIISGKQPGYCRNIY